MTSANSQIGPHHFVVGEGLTSEFVGLHEHEAGSQITLGGTSIVLRSRSGALCVGYLEWYPGVRACQSCRERDGPLSSKIRCYYRRLVWNIRMSVGMIR